MSVININNILANYNKLAPSNYQKVNIDLTTMKELSYYISKVEKGIEVGSQEYVEYSDYSFLRTAAFNDNYYSIVIDNNSLLCIKPKSFVDVGLKKGDILICKDSNVGEVAILYDNMLKTMYSAGINRLIFKSHSKLFFALMKNNNFKNQLYSMIPKGATIKHAKDLYLNCRIPNVNDNEIIDYIEKLVDIIINKEKEIHKKSGQINEIINNELIKNQKKDTFLYRYPKLDNIKKAQRLDTGNYTEEYKKIEYTIMNYKNGFFYIDSNKIKGGNTPKDRYVDANKDLDFLWIIPTFINDEGTITDFMRINCSKNNINSNCCLITNRTSKGGFGEYVGLAAFYDFEKNGKAQHNQGIYRVTNYSDEMLMFIACLLNSPLYRKICANLSMGSKMKELKLNNFVNIPFPMFPSKYIDNICKLYSGKYEMKKTKKLQFLTDNIKADTQAGIMELYDSLNRAKKRLNDVVDKLYQGEKIAIEYEVF